MHKLTVLGATILLGALILGGCGNFGKNADKPNREDATMLVVTQKIRTAQGADKILLLDEGKVVGYGTHDDLMEQSMLYQQIAQSQSEGEVKSDATHNS